MHDFFFSRSHRWCLHPTTKSWSLPTAMLTTMLSSGSTPPSLKLWSWTVNDSFALTWLFTLWIYTFFGHARLNYCLCCRSWRQSFQCSSESRFFHYGYTFWRRNHLSVEEFWIGSCSEEGQREDGEINEQYHSSVNSINDFLSHSLCWFHTYVTMFYSEIKTPFLVLAIDGHWLNQLLSLFLLDFKVLHMCKCK